MTRTRKLLYALSLVMALADTASGQPPATRDIILATTTSTQDSGLLDLLVPIFEKQSGYRVKTVAVGTGQALAMGARGDADLVLAHAPQLEMTYLREGAFINRRLVMHNDFILVGPPGDPAKIKGMRRLKQVFTRLAEAKGPFVSRGDQSGTHLLERDLWENAGVKPEGAWYIQVGQGMGAALNVASEKQAYTLTDRATYLALKKRLALEILVQGSKRLLNVYHVMEVNPERFPKVNHTGARAFADFITAPGVQALIGTFGTDTFGEPLFVPDAGKLEADVGR